MTTFKQFMAESLEDKGTFKAIFIVGIPGAGKSYTSKQLKGTVSPVIVNTDRATEYLTKKLGKESNSENWADFKDSAHRITTTALSGYLNGVLPLFIDGTSNDASNILSRAGILESLGYDVGMIFVSAPLDVALKRVKERAKTTNRDVGEDFVRKVHAQSEENRSYFKSKFSFYKEINNFDDLLDDEAMNDAFKKVQEFYNKPLENPVGKRIKEKMIESKSKYLVPEILTKEALAKKLDGWYRN